MKTINGAVLFCSLWWRRRHFPSSTVQCEMTNAGRHQFRAMQNCILLAIITPWDQLSLQLLELVGMRKGRDPCTCACSPCTTMHHRRLRQSRQRRQKPTIAIVIMLLCPWFDPSLAFDPGKTILCWRIENDHTTRYLSTLCILVQSVTESWIICSWMTK